MSNLLDFFMDTKQLRDFEVLSKYDFLSAYNYLNSRDYQFLQHLYNIM